MYLLLSWIAPASAFCGTYVGAPDSAVTNAGSEVVVTRQGTTTTLTLENEFVGDLSEFGLVVPVPATLDVSAITTVDQGVLDALDAYTAPRVVTYACEDVQWTWDTESDQWEGSVGSSSGCGGGSSSTDFTKDTAAPTASGGGLGGERVGGTVTTTHVTVGAYEVDVVDASGAASLDGWLTTNGFVLPETARPLIDEAVNADSRFLALRIDPEAATDGYLPPLQLRYESEMVSLPLRLGTTSSAGVQDLIIYGVTTLEDGVLAISNYDDALVEDDCYTSDATGAYEAAFSAAVDGAEDARWVMEYAWAAAQCDPCPDGGALDDATVQALGFEGAASEAYITRLHLRYRPEQLSQDPQLYASGMSLSNQLRFVVGGDELEAYFPVCGEGYVEGGEGCPEPEDPQAESEESEVEAETDSGSSGCGLCPGSSMAWLLLAGWGMRRRR